MGDFAKKDTLPIPVAEGWFLDHAGQTERLSA